MSKMAQLSTIFLLLPLISFILPSTIASMQFAMRPENVTGFVGDTVILTCVVADKDEDIPVYWKRYDGSSTRLGPISRDRDTSSYAHFFPNFSPRLSIVGNESVGEFHLLISNLSLQDQGRYVCSFTNERGFGVYAPITYLTVAPRPRVISRGSTNPVCHATVSTPLQAVSVGTTVELVCDAYDRPDITSLAWYVGSSRASSLMGSCALLKSLSQRICTLRRTLTLSDIGVTFTCRAETGPGEQQERRPGFAPSCNLQPLTNAVTVTVQPTPTRVTAGETATFFCNARANPIMSPLRYTWFLNRDQQLLSATSRLVVSSTSGYMYDNQITCVVSDHFGYLGHGTAILIVEPLPEKPHGAPTTYSNRVTTRATTTEKLESTSGFASVTSYGNSSSIDILKPLSNPNNRQAKVFPLMLVISLAAGAVLMAILLVVITACIIKRKKQGEGNLDEKVVQLETIRPIPDHHPDNIYSSSKKPRHNPRKSRTPPVNDKTSEPEAGVWKNSQAPRTYAVLDPDKVDNDSLSSLDLQKILNKTEETTQDQTPPDITAPAPPIPSQDILGEYTTNASSGNAKLSRARSASTPGVPAVVYAGKMSQDGNAVAYAVTNIVEEGNWPCAAKNNDNPASALPYDNSRLRRFSPKTKGISRKRAMSSPVAAEGLTAGALAKGTTVNCNPSDKNPKSQSTKAVLSVDDACAYAEITEVVTGNADPSPMSSKLPGEPKPMVPSGGAISTVPEPPYPRSYLRSESAYAIARVVSPPAKEQSTSKLPSASLCGN